jgi:hypothetical protein
VNGPAHSAFLRAATGPLLAATTAAAGATAATPTQAHPQTQDILHVMMWIGLAIALLILAGAAIMMYRKRMFGADSAVDAAASIFDDLRRLHRDGLMSQEEYDVARKKLAARASAAMDKKAQARRDAASRKTDRHTPRADRLE